MKTILQKLFLVTLMSLCVTKAVAHDFVVNGIYYNIYKANEVEVTYRGAYIDSYSKEYSGRVVIPSSVTYNGVTYRVTSIGSSAFEDCTVLTQNFRWSSNSRTSRSIPVPFRWQIPYQKTVAS